EGAVALREPDRAHAEERVLLGRLVQVGQLLVAADVEEPNDDRPARERLEGRGVRAGLLGDRRCRRASHEHELRAKEPDALGPGLGGRARLLWMADVGEEGDTVPVARGERRAAQLPVELLLPPPS